MAFSFGRGRKASASANRYTGSAIPRAGGGSPLSAGHVTMGGGRMGTGGMSSAHNAVPGMARMPGEFTTASGQILREPLSARATTSMTNNDLTRKVLAERTRRNVANSAATGTRTMPGRNLPVLSHGKDVSPSGGNLPARIERNLPARIKRPRPVNVGNISHSPQTRRMLGMGRTTAREGVEVGGQALEKTARSTGGLADNAGRAASKGMHGKGLLIGLGAAVVAGLAYSGRRGEGTSSGRSSAYRN